MKCQSFSLSHLFQVFWVIYYSHMSAALTSVSEGCPPPSHMMSHPLLFNCCRFLYKIESLMHRHASEQLL